MEKNSYLKVQQAARRSRIHLISQILYLIIFLVLSGVLLSRVVPGYYYNYFTKDIVRAEESQPSYVKRTYPQTDSYSKWFLYRNDWFDITQSNLRPEWTTTVPKPFGKTEAYNLIKKVGYKNYEVAKVSNDFLLDKTTNVEFERMVSQTRGTAYQEVGAQFETLIDFLKDNGKYRVANIKVTFRLSQTKETVDELFVNDGPVELLRYELDYPNSQTLGYPKYAITEYYNEHEMTETDFIDKLNYLTENFSQYGNLGLYGKNLDNFSSTMQGGLPISHLDAGNFDILSFVRHDFEDVAEYIEDNGIKYSRVLMTGDCENLANWLEKNEAKIQSFEIEELTDWNGSMLAMKKEGN